MNEKMHAERRDRKYLQSFLRVKTNVTGNTVKFSLFVPPKRASIGKLIATKREGRRNTVLIDNVAVNAKFRGNGFGEYLLELCKEYFVNKGISHFVLEAEEDMARYGKLVQFYESNGFEISTPTRQPRLLYNGDQTLRVVEMDQTVCSPNTGMPSAVSGCALNGSPRFAACMYEEVLNKPRAVLSIEDALVLAESLSPGVIRRGVDLARALKEDEHPEWLQAIGLVYAVGVVQLAFAWESPLSGTPLEFVKKVKLPSWATTENLGPWNNLQYLRTVLVTLPENRAGINLPPEGLSVFEDPEDPTTETFWKSVLDQYVCMAESSTETRELEPTHLRMLEMYFPEPLRW